MEFMSARAADKWGISQRRVAVLCSENRIDNEPWSQYVDYSYYCRKAD